MYENLTEPVAAVLEKCKDRPLPLTRSDHVRRDEASKIESASAGVLFPGARDAAAALSGLFLILGCWEESHRLSQDLSSVEGSYWHAIAHRIEPDSWNSGYWFRRVGEHHISPRSIGELLYCLTRNLPWDGN